MSCLCDERVLSGVLEVAAGLTEIPRQVATFPEFRQAMLRELAKHPPLAGWKPRDEDDFGVMLLEMWAYVADVLAFYDEVHAHESYLRTARRRPSLARLVGRLGYLPRPAVAASVHLAAQASGRKPIALAAGTAFRSGAFDEEPPQVFELTDPAQVHPLANRWKVEPPRPETIGEAVLGLGSNPNHTLVLSSLWVEARSAGALKEGDPLLIDFTGPYASARACTAEHIEEVEGSDGDAYLEVKISPLAVFTAGIRLRDIHFSKPTQVAGLWSESTLTNSTTELTLDGLHRQIRPGDHILVSHGSPAAGSSPHRWFTVTAVSEPQVVLSAGGTTNAEDADGKTVSIEVPTITAPVTRLTLDAALKAGGRVPASDEDWLTGDVPALSVRYLFIPAGEVTAEAFSSVSSSASSLDLSALSAAGRFETPEAASLPSTFLLRDLNEAGALVSGEIDPATRELALLSDALDPGRVWETALTPPLTVYGNVLTATRGESVEEILGSGDASVASQTFKLKKAPLTYLASPTAGNEQGLISTLSVWVDGVLWREVPSFFGLGPEDKVYVVRQNDDEESLVTFGDGTRGRRLPTGTDNVVGAYRFGAGEAAPPAGGITQLVKPVQGLSSVLNPLAAFGGADRESAEELRRLAPRSALLLGRAISPADFEAAAAGVPGVRAVAVEWRWHPRRQLPVIQVYYVGDASLEGSVLATLRNLSEPGTHIAVEGAIPVPLVLSVDLEIDPAYRAEDVLAAVAADLLDEQEGLLPPGRIGIGKPLFHSVLVERMLSVEGTVAVREILHGDGSPFTAMARHPGAGRYFDFEAGGLVLNGEEMH